MAMKKKSSEKKVTQSSEKNTQSNKDSPKDENGEFEKIDGGEKDDVEGKKIPLRHNFPADSQPVYSNHFVVQHSEDGSEAFLMFFQVVPPLLVSPADAAAVQKLDSLPVECVARIVVSPAKIPAIIRALKTNYAKLQERFAELRPDASADAAEEIESAGKTDSAEETNEEN